MEFNKGFLSQVCLSAGLSEDMVVLHGEGSGFIKGRSRSVVSDATYID